MVTYKNRIVYISVKKDKRKIRYNERNSSVRSHPTNFHITFLRSTNIMIQRNNSLVAEAYTHRNVTLPNKPFVRASLLKKMLRHKSAPFFVTLAPTVSLRFPFVRPSDGKKPSVHAAATFCLGSIFEDSKGLAALRCYSPSTRDGSSLRSERGRERRLAFLEAGRCLLAPERASEKESR